jgi:hypothetical protein
MRGTDPLPYSPKNDFRFSQNWAGTNFVGRTDGHIFAEAGVPYDSILIGGDFRMVDNQPRTGVALFNHLSGSEYQLNPSFAPHLETADPQKNPTVYTIYGIYRKFIGAISAKSTARVLPGLPV